MAVSYSATLKTNRMQVMSDLVSNKVAAASTGTATAGSLKIGDGTLAGPGATGVLCTIALAVTPFTIAGAVATLAGTPLSGTASATGTASKAEIRSSTDAVIVSGLTVGTSGTDVILNSTSITNGQTVTISGAPPSTITHSA
jgi:hypothetical protein